MIFVPATALTDEITAFGTIATPMSLAILWVLSAMIDRKNAKLLKDINGTYLRTAIANEKFRQIDAHFDWLKDQSQTEALKRGLRITEPQ